MKRFVYIYTVALRLLHSNSAGIVLIIVLIKVLL